jgi:hypothetical protein
MKMKVVTSTWVGRCGLWRKDFRQVLQVRTSAEVQRFADDVRRTVQRKIRSGDVGGPPLSADWKWDKKKRRMDARTLIETGTMVKNVNVAAGLRTEGGDEGIVFGIGVFEKRSLRDAPQNLPLIHEKGSSGDHGVPKRPVWVRAVTETKATSPAYRRLARGEWFDLRSPRRFKG